MASMLREDGFLLSNNDVPVVVPIKSAVGYLAVEYGDPQNDQVFRVSAAIHGLSPLTRRDLFEDFCREYVRESNRVRMQHRAGLRTKRVARRLERPSER